MRGSQDLTPDDTVVNWLIWILIGLGVLRTDSDNGNISYHRNLSKAHSQNKIKFMPEECSHPRFRV